MFTNLRPVSRLVNVADTATILRRAMLGLAAAGIVATLVELATLRHWTTTTQLIPWFVLGVLAVGVLIVALGGSRQMIHVVRFIALAAAIGGLYGLYIHVKANYDAAILDYHYTDRWPTHVADVEDVGGEQRPGRSVAGHGSRSVDAIGFCLAWPRSAIPSWFRQGPNGGRLRARR